MRWRRKPSEAELREAKERFEAAFRRAEEIARDDLEDLARRYREAKSGERRALFREILERRRQAHEQLKTRTLLRSIRPGFMRPWPPPQ